MFDVTRSARVDKRAHVSRPRGSAECSEKRDKTCLVRTRDSAECGEERDKTCSKLLIRTRFTYICISHRKPCRQVLVLEVYTYVYI